LLPCEEYTTGRAASKGLPRLKKGDEALRLLVETVQERVVAAAGVSYKVARTKADLSAAFEIRRRVFVDEQRVPEDVEYDEFDPIAIHYLALLGDEPVGAARAVVSGEWAKIGRVAVLPEHRGLGIGIGITRYVEDDLIRRGVRNFYLHAQTWVQEFYRRLGYKAEGEVFREADIDHVKMTKSL
jgi:predicted GNAT family N-acyltransferase